jgi:hypothetical protein
MLTLAASDSSARALEIDAVHTAEAEVDRHLAAAREDAGRRSWLYGSLLAGKVYVTEHELVLGDCGPYVELQPRVESGGRGRVLAVYTSRRHLPAGVDPLDAVGMSFAEVVREVEAGVAVEINPGGELALQLGVAELELLRRVLARG